MNALILAFQILHALPEYDFTAQKDARPFKDVPSVQLVHELELYDGLDRSVLATFQLEELNGIEAELAKRVYETRAE